MVFLEKPRKVSEKTVFFTIKTPSHGDSKRKNFVTLSLCAFVVEFSDTSLRCEIWICHFMLSYSRVGMNP